MKDKLFTIWAEVTILLSSSFIFATTGSRNLLHWKTLYVREYKLRAGYTKGHYREGRADLPPPPPRSHHGDRTNEEMQDINLFDDRARKYQAKISGFFNS